MNYEINAYYLKLRDTAIRIARKERVSVDDAFKAAVWNEILWGFWPESFQNKEGILRDSETHRSYDRAMEAIERTERTMESRRQLDESDNSNRK